MRQAALRKAVHRSSAIAVIVIGCSGCAGVKIYSDGKLTQETGIRHFAPKPYLLVTRTGAQDKPIEVAVIYVPNLEEPYYAVAKSGLGASKLTLKLTDGILTEFGNESDSKVPELLTAAGGLLTGMAGAFKTTTEGLQLLRQESASREELDRAAELMEDVAATLRKAARPQELTQAQITSASNAITALENDAKLLRTPQGPDQASAVAERLTKVREVVSGLTVPGSPPPTEAAASWNSTIDKLKGELTTAITLLKGPPPAEATFELYEFIQKEGVTTLRRVPTPK